jgi:quercetin dioxygenase-like cupin family protein
MRRFLVTAALVCAAGLTAWCQQLPTPEKQAKILFENDQVRILQFVYHPGDKSPMHSHPDNVAIALTDSHVRVIAPDGKVSEASGKAGTAKFRPAFQHSVENIGDKDYEGIIVELKCKPAEAKTATGK